MKHAQGQEDSHHRRAEWGRQDNLCPRVPPNKMMNRSKIQIRDKDLANVEVALLRAAKRAREIAEQTHTPLVVYEGGSVVKKFIGKEKSRQA